VFEKLNNISNVTLIEPVSYDEMVYLMMRSFLIMTDSGGIQEEAPSLGKPVVILREVTERPEGVKSGCSVLAGTTSKKIFHITSGIIDTKRIYTKMAKANNPYGNGDSAKRIASVLNKEFLAKGS
jgi:UDP-N-acetylglucosamine 2-epimerase (non-hydrolysing)